MKIKEGRPKLIIVASVSVLQFFLSLINLLLQGHHAIDDTDELGLLRNLSAADEIILYQVLDERIDVYLVANVANQHFSRPIVVFY